MNNHFICMQLAAEDIEDIIVFLFSLPYLSAVIEPRTLLLVGDWPHIYWNGCFVFELLLEWGMDPETLDRFQGK
jgi:hypothetical protein